MTESLIVVGSGIKFMSHLTTEAIANIEQSDKVLYLVNEPAIKEWIQEVNPNSESLEFLYNKHHLRLHSYKTITNYILETLRKKQHVCVVLYGHPTVFSKPCLDAVIQAKKEGFYAKILPGISSEDCLFADLLIDPGSHGCISLEATDLLIRQRKLDPSYHLILWQISIIGAVHHAKQYDNKKGIQLVRNYLSQYYALDHIITLYSAAQYPGLEPLIQEFPLRELSSIQISRTSTLYIPPVSIDFIKNEMLDELNININDLK